MPRIVPSQVVDLIDKTVEKARAQAEAGGDAFSLNREHSAICAAIIELTDQIPPELLVLSGERYTEYVAAIAAVKDSINTWKALRYAMEFTPGFKRTNPITSIRQALARCPDEFPSTETARLTFIADPELRRSLEIDMSAVNRALSNCEWKAATVLAGSVIEALLLWALKEKDPGAVQKAVNDLVLRKTLRQPDTLLDNWDLHTYIEVSAELGAIKSESAQQARLAKGFRNLIHAGREARLSQKCDRGTALSAVAAVEFVIRDLT